MSDSATPLMIAATIDVSDLEAASQFWSQLLGVEVLGIHEPFAFLGTAENRKIAIWLQQVEEVKTVKNRCHLDFVASDLEAAEKKVVELGGSLAVAERLIDLGQRAARRAAAAGRAPPPPRPPGGPALQGRGAG